MNINFCNDTELNILDDLLKKKKDIDDKLVYMYLCPPIIFICFCGVIFNLVVMNLSRQSINRQSRSVNKSPILLLSLNLALTDVVALLLNGLNILINTYLRVLYDVPKGFCPLLAFEALRISALVASALHLLALAVVHYRRIVKPLHFRTINIISVCCWIIPLTIILAWFSLTPCQGFQSEICEYQFIMSHKYRYMVLTLFAFPLIIMSVIYGYLFVFISRLQKARIVNQERSTLTRGVMRVAQIPAGTAAAVNLPELLIAQAADASGQDIRCAACAARTCLEEDPSVSIFSEELMDSSDEQSAIAHDIKDTSLVESKANWLDNRNQTESRALVMQSSGTGNKLTMDDKNVVRAAGENNNINSNASSDVANDNYEPSLNLVNVSSAQKGHSKSQSQASQKKTDVNCKLIGKSVQEEMRNNNSYYDCDASKNDKKADEQQKRKEEETAAAAACFEGAREIAQKRGFLFLIRPIIGRSRRTKMERASTSAISNERTNTTTTSVTNTTNFPLDRENKLTLAIDITSSAEQELSRASLIDVKQLCDETNQDKNKNHTKITTVINYNVNDSNGKLKMVKSTGKTVSLVESKDLETDNKQDPELPPLDSQALERLGTKNEDQSLREAHLPTFSESIRNAVSSLGFNKGDEAKTSNNLANQTSSSKKATQVFRMNRQQSNPVSSDTVDTLRKQKCTCDGKSTVIFEKNTKLLRSNTIGGGNINSIKNDAKENTPINKRKLSARLRGTISSVSQKSAISSSAVASHTTDNKSVASFKSSLNKFSKTASISGSQVVSTNRFGTRGATLSTSNATLSSSTYEPQRRHIHASALPPKNTKALVTTLLILGTYVISYAPTIIFSIISCVDSSMCPYPLFEFPLSWRIFIGSVTTVLLIAKSIVDPFIYSCRMSEVQVAVSRYLSKRRSKSSTATSMCTSQKLNKSFNNNSNNSYHHNSHNHKHNYNLSNLNISKAETQANSSIKILSSYGSNLNKSDINEEAKASDSFNRTHQSLLTISNEKDDNELLNINHIRTQGNTQNQEVIALITDN